MLSTAVAVFCRSAVFAYKVPGSRADGGCLPVVSQRTGCCNASVDDCAASFAARLINRSSTDPRNGSFTVTPPSRLQAAHYVASVATNHGRAKTSTPGVGYPIHLRFSCSS